MPYSSDSKLPSGVLNSSSVLSLADGDPRIELNTSSYLRSRFFFLLRVSAIGFSMNSIFYRS